MNILILGASYGSLLGTKLAMAGHSTTLCCLPHEAELINKEGTVVRIPFKGRDDHSVVASKDLPGTINASTPVDTSPADFDLICLAMQEPQYAAPEVTDLLKRIGESGKPVMSIMNKPPLPFLKRIPALKDVDLNPCYSAPEVWAPIKPSQITLCSPDPQAFRPPEEPLNLLHVALPTNFKAAAFENPEHTALLTQLEADIQAVRFDGAEVPVKLRVHDSLFTPLAKWAMLTAGNYRCVLPDGARAIKEAVHSDITTSDEIYNWVVDLCVKIGAERSDLVPFEKYAAAAKGLPKPSSAARAIEAGAPRIERVDLIVQTIAKHYGMSNSHLDTIVETVNARLAANRAKQAA